MTKSNFIYENEEKWIQNIFDSSGTTLIFLSQGYSHFNAYSFTPFTVEENLHLKDEIFSFHAMSFQFFVVVQFCKLFEPGGNRKRGASSLKNLNQILGKKYGDEFRWFDENNGILEEIQNSVMFKKIKILRNKCYGHSQIHSLNKPMTFNFLNESETDELKQMLIKSIQVYRNCYRHFGIGTDFQNWYNSSSPKNFLKQYFQVYNFWKEHHSPSLGK